MIKLGQRAQPNRRENCHFKFVGFSKGNLPKESPYPPEKVTASSPLKIGRFTQKGKETSLSLSRDPFLQG